MTRDDPGPHSNDPGPLGNDPGPIATGPVTKGHNISVGDVRGTGIIIGHGSSASVNQLSAQSDAAELLDELIQLLARDEGSVADAAGIRESAEVVKAELMEPSPRWRVVRSLLRGIAAGVAGVSVLAEVVNSIQVLVAQSGVNDQGRQ
jgi:hypothetical protein